MKSKVLFAKLRMKYKKENSSPIPVSILLFSRTTPPPPSMRFVTTVVWVAWLSLTSIQLVMIEAQCTPFFVHRWVES
jgi:hypothetical protein